jgi:putative transposase
MSKFQNKYRIESTRLRNWGYGWNAAYFVTICTGYRICYFGEIQNGVMHFSESGEIARRFWIEIPNHFSFVKLNAFVVMPNHVHGILIIDKPFYGRDNKTIAVQNAENTINAVDTPNLGVSTTIFNAENIRGDNAFFNAENIRGDNAFFNAENIANAIPQKSKYERMKMNWQPGTLGVIINQYKRACTIKIRKINPEFDWQPRFYDIIIRNDDSFTRIRNYIIDNPEKWCGDNFNI